MTVVPFNVCKPELYAVLVVNMNNGPSTGTRDFLPQLHPIYPDEFRRQRMGNKIAASVKIHTGCAGNLGTDTVLLVDMPNASYFVGPQRLSSATSDRS